MCNVAERVLHQQTAIFTEKDHKEITSTSNLQVSLPSTLKVSLIIWGKSEDDFEMS